jgi:asparagine synthase (glutamine-hydrolysing)
MCGFVVIYSKNKMKLDPRILEKMTNTLDHRGPDDFGYVFAGPSIQKSWQENTPDTVDLNGVAMGHRRLSILDLSPAGRQPFVSNDRRYYMVYNGEIFNYVELRNELKSLGYNFRTNTDTEVVLNAYIHWGEKSLNLFNGMWALIIWDNVKQTLFISRDRFGIKPLYYYQNNDIWIFASEIKAILQYSSVTSSPNKKAIFHFLLSEQPPYDGETYFNGINSFNASAYAIISGNEMTQNKYWNLNVNKPADNFGIREISDNFLKIFHDAVKIRLRSDVKVGTMLSGGLDSTSIAKTINDLIRANSDDVLSVGSVQTTFSACFPNTILDETDRINELADQLNLDNIKIFPMREDVLEIFQKVVHSMEAPFTKSTPIVQFLLMHLAKKQGVKVVLNGHGADEMLAGYSERYCPILVADYLLHVYLIKCFKEAVAMRKMHKINFIEIIYSLLTIIAPKLAHLLKENLRFQSKKLFSKNWFINYPLFPQYVRDRKMEGKSALDRRLKQEFFFELLPVWLNMEDKISMSASVESRLPFMDYRLVEFVFNLSNQFKIKNGVTKFILRDAMKNHLPSKIINEKKKYTFSGPEIYWLRNPFRSQIEMMFLDGEPLVSEFVKLKQIRNLLSIFLKYNKGSDWERRLVWRIFNVEMWLKTFFG